MSELLVLAGILIAGVSGVPGLFLSRRTLTGQWIATSLAVVASVAGLTGAGTIWSVQTLPRFP